MGEVKYMARDSLSLSAPDINPLKPNVLALDTYRERLCPGSSNLNYLVQQFLKIGLCVQQSHQV